MECVIDMSHACDVEQAYRDEQVIHSNGFFGASWFEMTHLISGKYEDGVELMMMNRLAFSSNIQGCRQT